jgi:hypothetical protein
VGHQTLLQLRLAERFGGGAKLFKTNKISIYTIIHEIILQKYKIDVGEHDFNF